ncbi:MAG: M36 family metallopeptidase [Bryobacteraceae bacterium]
MRRSVFLLALFLVLGINAAGPAWGQPADASRKHLLPDFDFRDVAAAEEPDGGQQSQAQALLERRRAGIQSFLAAEVAANLGTRITPNRFGVPKLFLREGRALSAPSTQQPEEIAKGFLRSHAAIFPFAGAEVDNLRLLIQDVARDATFLAFNQTVDGIDVFNGQIKFTLSKAGEVVEVAAGDITPGLSLSTTPRLSLEEAVRAAIRAAAAGAPATLTPFADSNGKPGFLNPRGDRFNPITVELSVFPLTASSARLAYRVFLDIDAERYYEILVDATDGSLLFRHNLYVRGAQGTVWRQSPIVGSRQLVTFPPSDDPLQTPDPWLSTSANGASNTGWVTSGNNTDTYLDATGDDQPDSTSSSCMQNGRAYSATEDFTFPFGDGTVGLDPRGYQCAAVANLFYFVNLAHDFYYSLGFTESAGNLQTDNYGRGGVGHDAVLAEAQFGGFTDNSDFSPTPEGTPPHLRMGLYTLGTTTKTDDLDADYGGQTAIHEYGHGVSNRLVGAGTSTSCLAQIQSGAMGEGWSDYFAISYFNNPVYGAYQSQNPISGLRRQSYQGYTYTYADVGNGSYGYEVHDDGEIWAATLWDLRNSLGQAVTDRLVINGLKSTPCNPSMTDARDAILAADQAANGGANRATIWQVFAKHGLGFSARGIDGSLITGTVYDAGYDQPPDLQSAKNPAITSSPLSIATSLGQSYLYQVTASNPNGGVLNYSLTSGPAGMTVNSASGSVSWAAATFASPRVEITVTDGKGGRVVHGYALPVFTSLNPGSPVTISGALNSAGFAGISVPAGVPVLQVTLRNGSGDPLLGVTAPDGNSISIVGTGTTLETLSFANPIAGNWLIEVDGYAAYSGVSLTAALITPTVLDPNTTLSGLSDVMSGETFYRVTIPPGMSAFSVSTSGGSGMVDLFLRKGAPAVCATVFFLDTCLSDALSVGTSTSKSIRITNPAAGDWYVDVAAYATYSGVTLTTTTTAAAPTVTGYTWTTTPLPNQPFSGTITGTGFVAPMSVWFCPSSGSCQQLPASQVTINSTTSASVTNVTLAAGSWQVYVQTNGGPSARSASFVVGGTPSSAPTITGYSWTTTPQPNQPFSGTITGTNFSLPIVVWFCPSSGSCQQLAASQVTLNSATSLSVTGVTLAAGSWQVYVQTNGGPSGRSASFTVGPTGAPTVTGYTWTTTPTSNQPFSGTISGTNFSLPIVIWFCPSSGSCLQLAASQVTLYSATSIGVSNVVLATAGSWQVYVQTNGGPSARSMPFTVVQSGGTGGGPTVISYSWNTTPTANQPFSGTIAGTGFSSPIAVWFCPSSGSCLQLAASQVTLYSATSIGVSNVILATAGSWQVYVQTNAGPSARSMPFTVVQSGGTGGGPTVISYSWNTTPAANQPFSGTITGTGFYLPIVVWFCPSSGSCQQLASSQVTLNSDTSLGVTGVTLTAGSWQLYVQTNSGPSGRSTTFIVQAPPGALVISNVAVQVSGTGVLTVNLDFSGAAGKITFGASCGGAGATDLGCAWILFEPDSGTGYRLGGAFLNKAGVDSGTVSSGDLPQPFSTLLGPMNVRVTLIDNAGNRSNSVVVPVAHWFQW